MLTIALNVQEFEHSVQKHCIIGWKMLLSPSGGEKETGH